MASDLFAGLEVKGKVVPKGEDQTAREVMQKPDISELFGGLEVGGEVVPPQAKQSIQQPVQAPIQQTPVIKSVPETSQFQRVPEAVPAEGGLSAFGEGLRRGAEQVGEGILQRGAQALQAIGVDTQEFLNQLEISRGIQKQQFAPTQEQFPVAATVGEIAGEAAALPIPAARLKTAAATGGLIGGLRFGEEGGAAELGKNILTDATFGLAGQVVAERAVGLIKGAAQKLGISKIPDNLFNADGSLKPEAGDFLANEGVSVDDLSSRVIADIQAQPEGADVAQALRVAQAKELGVQDLTRADISQRFADQSTEFQLSRQRGTPEAEALRQSKAAQNQQIIAAGETIIRGAGGEADKLRAGQAIQDALRSDRGTRREAITQLYNIAEQQAGVSLPVEQEGIARVFADQDFLFGLDPDIGGQLQAVKKQLEAFSILPPEILKSEADLARIRPLDIGSAEQLRKNVRALISDTDPKSQRALSPFIEAIDDAIDGIAISDELGESAQQAFKKARQARTQFAQDFEAKDIVQQITSFKPGTQTDLVAPSVAFDKIMGSQARLENTQAIKQALLSAGPEGKQAWQDFKATSASELLGKALTTGKTATGDLRFSGANFNKALKSIGDDTLKVIFDQPGELARIKQLGRVSRDLTILQDGVFTPSGAQVENALEKISKLALFRLSPTANVVVNEGADQLRKGQRRRELSKVINPEIDIVTADDLGTMSNNAVNVLRLLGLAGQRKITEEE